MLWQNTIRSLVCCLSCQKHHGSSYHRRPWQRGMKWSRCWKPRCSHPTQASGCAYGCVCILVKRCPGCSRSVAGINHTLVLSQNGIHHLPHGLRHGESILGLLAQCTSSSFGLLLKLWSGKQHLLVQWTELWWLCPLDILHLLLHVAGSHLSCLVWWSILHIHASRGHRHAGWIMQTRHNQDGNRGHRRISIMSWHCRLNW